MTGDKLKSAMYERFSADSEKGEADLKTDDCDDEDPPFKCSVCWDLVYKPVVQACGHIFCFWCVHFTMRGYSTSQCPICRRAYGYFPQACQMLDSLFRKIMPVEYLRREREVQAFEAERKIWSSPCVGNACPSTEESGAPINSSLIPQSQPVDNLSSSDRNPGLICLTDIEIATGNLGGNTHRSGDAILPSVIIQSTAENADSGSGCPASFDYSSFDATLACSEIVSVSMEDAPQMHSAEQHSHFVGSTSNISSIWGEFSPPQNGVLKDNGVFKQLWDVSQVGKVGCSEPNPVVSISDVLCKFCHQLLCLPVVLMCGHVFCQDCVPSSEDEKVICPSCQSPHQEQYLDVCLEMHFYLQRTFPKEYNIRLQVKVDSAKPPSQTTAVGKSSSKKNGARQSCVDSRGPPHVGIGCDGCGMFPVYGKAFHCNDCPSIIGYDLCESCYAIGPDLPGRFNQHHTRDHTMVEIPLRSGICLEVDSLQIVFLPEDMHESE